MIGGYDDQVHILCMLSKKLPLAKLLELVKSHSSKWIKQKGPAVENFYWQDGYGAFSVSPSHVQAVAKYIQNQRAHHSKQDFKNEFRTLLHKNQVEYDERYVWD